MKIYINGRSALKILLNYFRDNEDVPWDDSSKINKLVKKYINGGFDNEFIESAIMECQKILDLETLPQEWIKQETGESILKTEAANFKVFLEKLLKTLQLQFQLLQERKDNYCFKNIFKIDQDTKKFYDDKYGNISCLAQYFKYYYDDADNIKKLMFEKENSEINEIKNALENILQENPFPYKWLANSIQRKIISNTEGDISKKYYDWVVKILNLIKTAQATEKVS